MMLTGAALFLLAVAVIAFLVLKGPLTVKLPANASVPDQPVSFGYKNTWLAVKAENTKAVAEFLGDPKAQTCNWKTGIERAYRADQLFAFITPPLAGWTLVVGYALPSADTKGSEEAVVRLIDRLSKVRRGAVVHFASCCGISRLGKVDQRPNDPSLFIRGREGRDVVQPRPPTSAEPAKLFDSSGPEQQVSVFPDEKTVMQIAAAWSVDPCKIEERNLPAGLGLLLLASSCEALRTRVR